jgi:hypothetical protein
MVNVNLTTLSQYRVENEDVPVFWGACEKLIYKPDDCQLVGTIQDVPIWEYVVMDKDVLINANTQEVVAMECFVEVD